MDNSKSMKAIIHSMLDQFEHEVLANRPIKSLPLPMKGKAYDVGRVGTIELKKVIDKLSSDDKNAFLVAGLVIGCLNLGRDAGEYLTSAKAKEILEPMIKRHLKQKKVNKSKEYFFKDECLKVAELTWKKYPSATAASRAAKLCDFFCNIKNYHVSQNTVEKKWLADAPFRPKIRGDRTLQYELVTE